MEDFNITFEKKEENFRFCLVEKILIKPIKIQVKKNLKI